MPLARRPATRHQASRRRPQVSKGGGQRRAWSYLSWSAGETDHIGRLIGRSLKGGEVLALYGELGVGKTALTRGIAVGLGAPPRAVSSPTFVLVNLYHGRLQLAHVDLYRIRSEAELDHLGLSDFADDRTVLAIEWADRAGTALPADRVGVWLSHHTERSRRVTMRATGTRSAALLARFKDLLVTAPLRAAKGRAR